MKFSKSPPGLWRAHKESLASKQPVSSAEYQLMNFESIFEEKNKRQSSLLQHFHNWGRRLWRPALIAMVKAVEQQSSNLALWADGACPWHPDTPRYTQWAIISSDHFLLVVQMPSMAIDKDQHLYTSEKQVLQNSPNIWATCSGNPLVCDCEMRWYKRGYHDGWQVVCCSTRSSSREQS